MKLSDHLEGYFPVDKITLNIFNKGWIIIVEQHFSISLSKKSKPGLLLFFDVLIAESISSAFIL